MLSTNTYPEETNIAVWGPTQSGKDWLYKGFAQELEHFHSRFSDKFDFILQEKTGMGPFTPVIAEPPSNIVPTTYVEDYIHSFIRKPKPGYEDGKYTEGILTHYINFHNNRGADLVAAIMDRDRFEPTYLAITESKYLLILLDPLFDKSSKENLKPNENSTTSDDEGNEEYPEIALRPGISKEDYYKILTLLLKELTETKVPNRHIAICITKNDAIKIKSNNPWALLERVFGQRISRLFNSYRSTFNMEVFATSAAGYTKIRGVYQPNFSNGKLLHESNWDPFNCAAPFFWMFQHREIENIKNTSNFLNRDHNLRKYIPYPPPRQLF